MTAATDQLLLYGIFRQLRAAGLPLSVRDYLDALDALRLFAEPFDALHGVAAAPDAEADHRGDGPVYRIRERTELVWLCQTLWARTNSERRAIRDAITLDLGPPPADLAMTLFEQLSQPSQGQPDDPPEPRPTTPEAERKAEAEQESKARARRKEIAKEESETQEAQKSEGKSEGRSGSRSSSRTAGGNGEKHKSAFEDASAPVAVSTGDGPGDFTIPRLDDVPPADGERFFLGEKPIMSPLWLTSLWRRLFVPVLREDRAEVDVSATVKLAARHGRITRPVMKSRRVNAAKLLVLIDVSDAMAPWRGFLQMVRDTLHSHTSRLDSTTIAHFSGAPATFLYENPLLRKGKKTSELLADCARNPLLVFGEAGATGRSPLHLESRLWNFFAQVSEHDIRPIVWINPMPKERWHPGAIEALPRSLHIHALELNAETLLHAIDLIRGAEE